VLGSVTELMLELMENTISSASDPPLKITEFARLVMVSLLMKLQFLNVTVFVSPEMVTFCNVGKAE
jgi:hypothetical protein